jgi:glycosyltransferase involved in cell wall biosynthesis
MVSVLMPSFNYAHYLPTAIESVLSQRYSDLELIIVDDCSTDESWDIAQKYKRLDSRVVSVRHDRNGGLAATRNTALAASSAQFVALCDADDIWLPHKLAAQLGCFRSGDGHGVVHSDGWIIDDKGHRSGGLFSDLFHREGQRTSGDLFTELCRRNFICVPTVTLRREAILDVGGFEKGLRSLEDWVCWTKIARKYKSYYLDEPLVEYRLHGRSLSQNSRNMASSRVEALGILLRSIPDISRMSRSSMLYSLGMSQVELHNLAEAAAAFRNSLLMNPLQVRSWIRLGQCLSTSVFSKETPRS